MIKLKKLLFEQTTAAPAGGTTAAAPAETTDKWGIPGFTAPAVGASFAEFGPNAENAAASWISAYETYLDNASGWIGKTVVVFKREMLYVDEIVAKFVVQSLYAYSRSGPEGQKPVRIWSTKQATRNFDTAAKKLIIRKGTKEEAKTEDGDYLLAESAGSEQWNAMVNANITAQLAWEDHPNYPGSNDKGIAWSVYNPGKMNDLKITGGDYSIDWAGKVYQAGKHIGYCPVTPYYNIQPIPDGYGTVLVGGDEIPLQDETWRNSSAEPETTKKKKK
jgi:hypothetical protein